MKHDNDYDAVQKRQIEGIKEALRSLDCGESVPHEVVKAWVESLGTESELPKPGRTRAAPNSQKP